ncbi:MAG: hypothetical protein IPP32_13460 [Bacteroidetes bacterium]|nr:hypothetical protein [Bacteroidota bacterium]
MKKFATLLILLFTVLINGCKKDESTTETPEDTTPACTPTVVEVTTNISSPTTWDPCHIYVINASSIDVSSTLTIQAGTIIKFKNNVFDNAITVSATGQINAVGTADKPIVFTSFKDDANGGDTNGDGTTSTPARGDWGGIVMNTSSCVYKYCTFLYGGEGPSPGAGQPTLEFQSFYGIIDRCTFAFCGGEAVFNGYGVVDARSCHDTNFKLTNSIFYGCIKPVFINPFLSIDNSNVFHNPNNAAQKNDFNGIFITNEANEALSDVSWLEDEVPFVLTGSLYITHPGTKLILAAGVIIKVKDSPAPGNKITYKEGMNSIQGYGLPGVYFTSYLDDAHGGDTNGDGNASSPAFADWYGIQDITASISTNNFCYNWSNILYAQYP